MKAEDLMIEDWVRNQDGTIKGRIVNIDAYQNRVEFGAHTIDADFVYPIPLTPEILEKNNDILYGELPILFDDGKMHYSIIECRYVSKEYERNGETFYCLLSGCAYHGGSFVTPFAKIRYVHELQHALKLCGIEKEIVL